jgi:hypothetical protein
MHEYKWGLLKVRKGNTKRAWWGAGGVHWKRELGFFCFVFFSGAFKIYTNPCGGQTWEISTQ